VKKAALISVVLVLILGGILVYGLVNTHIRVADAKVQVIPCSAYPEEFSRLQADARGNALVGTVFRQDVEGPAEEYCLLVYELKLKNPGFLPMEMVELQISPLADDQLSYTDGSAQGAVPQIAVGPGRTAVLRQVLMTKAQDKPRTVRDLYITYYIWGNPFKVKYTFGT
jgi:hypothetical protein